ncbi:hypothetical protein SB778_21145 [Paraburkholderia sp. SIMBA_050]
MEKGNHRTIKNQLPRFGAVTAYRSKVFHLYADISGVSRRTKGDSKLSVQFYKEQKDEYRQRRRRSGGGAVD